MSELIRLYEITQRLREPGGCEWDRAQDYSSMRRYLLEETHELIDAVDRQDFENMKEELGDVLFHIFFYARLGAEERRFTLEDVARGIADKLVRRHPHVFGDTVATGVDEILRNWESIKSQEKGQSDSIEADPWLPENTGRGLPALLRAEKIQQKAARLGFDWTNAAAVVAKIREEVGELEAEMSEFRQKRDTVRLEEELGDILFSVVNLARHLELAPEACLNRANRKFLSRFGTMERLARQGNQKWLELTASDWDSLWHSAKRAESP